MSSKASLFMCTCCQIAECLDVSAIEQKYASMQKFAVFSHKQLCSEECRGNIRSFIEHQSVNSMIIAACSPRYYIQEFDFGIKSERVSLRELVCWSHENNPTENVVIAEDYINMAFARLATTESPNGFIPENQSDVIAVVGGGISGIQAAIDGAKAGYKVLLIEKEKELGGYLKNIHQLYPLYPPFDALTDNILPEKIKEIFSLNQIEVQLGAEITKTSGQPGSFCIQIRKDDEITERNAGAIVLASGWKAYDATKLTEFGYGLLPNVVTSIEFEQMVKDGKIKKPSDGQIPKNILFVQCAGSRNEKHLPYCSNYCCNTTLKQSRYIRENIPEASVFVVYQDMRATGRMENFYKEVQMDDHLFFTKGSIKSIEPLHQNLMVNISDNLFGEDIGLECDLVVLAIGMQSAGANVLHLDYRLGEDLPALKYDFTDSHFICFPYETRRTGIYAAGAVRAPMDIAACIEDSAGAMMKAIQCVEMVKRGESLHPRSGDKSYPEINFLRCTDCKRCTEECPFGTYTENEKGTPIVHATRCRRCGICMGACPERVISFNDFNILSVSEMIKAVSMPDEFEEKPRILAFVCENDAYPAFDMAAAKKLNYSPFLRIIPVRCLGSVNKIWLSDALSKGFDGILLFGCKPGENYQCHFIHGSELTEKRGENISEVLQKMMLEPERIKTVFLEIDEYDKIPAIINNYVEELSLIGMNPFKGM